MSQPFSPSTSHGQPNPDCVLFHKSRIYEHRIIRFNFTSYDMRRDQDIINPRTPHCNIMLLALSDGEAQPLAGAHPFLYGRVLKIFHANVVYKGPGMSDYTPRRLYFLWVRWYDLEPVTRKGKSTTPYELDRLVFPPVSRQGAFGFLDPSDVLRGCHIIPAFAKGRSFPDGKGMSKWARDSDDWKGYYISR